MARGIRIKLDDDDVVYHVMNRVNHGEFLLSNPIIKELLYRRLLAIGEIYYIQLHAIAILDNHWHAIFTMRKPECNLEDVARRYERRRKVYPSSLPLAINKIETWHQRFSDLSELMKDFCQGTAQMLNRIYGTDGHFWQRRFKSVLLERDHALLVWPTWS